MVDKATKPAKSVRETLRQQMDETVAHLVDENAQRVGLKDEFDDIEGEIKRLKDLIDDQKVLLREKTEEIKESEQRILFLIDELSALSNGKPRLPHITPTIATDSVDPADKHGITELTRFGMTAKQIEKLEDSVLAVEHSVKSIGDLIRTIGKDQWWHKKVKGWGDTAIEKVTDALTLYRDKHPIPEQDGRLKECQTCADRYEPEMDGCPTCDSRSYMLVDPNEPKKPANTTQLSLVGSAE